MSLVTSREVVGLAGPVGGGPAGDGRRLRPGPAGVGGPRERPGAGDVLGDIGVFGLVDTNGNGLAGLSLDCNCNEQKSAWFEEMEWGYAESNGPATWHEKYPLAAGPRQSPVDLSSSTATQEEDSNAKPLHRRYNPQTGCVLGNTGYGWKVQIAGPTTARKDDLMFWFSELSGGPLASRYRLEQFHMHWGDCDNEGSEHTVDGQSYAGELHLVHWNCDKYNSFGEAASQPDGLAVLGVFLKVGEANKELLKVTDLMSQITHKGQHVDITGEVDPTNLLPAKSSYWTYLGSLTTPPCNESVIWIVFKEQLTVSQEQLEAMRGLRCYSEGEACPCDELKGVLLKNFRPPLPLGNRRVRECRE
ncbi:carbonic anhydrase 13 [Thrips palmi]|uniref:Carbonic anhydrase n=1 Tax=Thrips palmi TaxID=161013 RepID=A0A6P8YJJ4_THRPL|nr:carbonic anhydrase 13 [Thrips palmi]